MNIKILITIGFIVAVVLLAKSSGAVPDGSGREIFLGNVGVGTTTPQTALAITNGNVGIGTWTADGGRLIIMGGNVGIGSMWPGMQVDITGTVRSTQFVGDGSLLTGVSVANGWSQNTGVIFTTTASDNVGIATSAPLSLLEITSTAAQDLFKVNDAGPGDASPFIITSTGNIGIGTTTATTALIDITSTATFDLFKVNDTGLANDTTPFVITSDGNVGIGSAVPNNKFVLDSSGSGTGNRFVFNAMGGMSNRTLAITTMYNGISGWGGPVLQSCETNAVGAGQSCNGTASAGGSTSIILQYFGGNVGIGTFEPAGKLIVMGGNVGIGSPLPRALLEVNSSASQDLFRVNDADGDTTPFLINSNGNVGVGSANPGTPFDVLASDNTTAMRVIINATQANVTGADTFISFNSSSGQEGSITGTGGAGVIAYNTFTGSHWTMIDDRSNLEKFYVLEATGEKFMDRKPQLVKSKICTRRQSPYVWGVYGGLNAQGLDLVMSLGTGLIWVANTNGDIEVGDYLQSSTVPGHAEKQDDSAMHGYTIAKALEPIVWKPGETRRLIACTYHAG